MPDCVSKTLDLSRVPEREQEKWVEQNKEEWRRKYRQIEEFARSKKELKGGEEK